MKKYLFSKLRFEGFSAVKTLFLSFFLLTSVNVWGQYSITGTGSGNTYTQNFNSFAGTLASVPVNWVWSWNDFTPGGYYNRTGSYSNANSTYALRESASPGTDIAFGAKVDGTSRTLTFSITNNTGNVINGFELAWNVEQYGRSTTATPVSFSYRLNSAAYGTVNASGTGTTPVLASAGSEMNLSSITVTNKTLSISSISLAVGGTADFRFTIGAGTSNNAHIGIDDFTMYATTASSNDTTSEVDGPVLTSQPDPVLISSLVDTQAEAVKVFDFDIYDYGTVDGLPTHVTQVTIKPGANNTANWLNSIEGVRLSLDGGSTFVTTGTPSITASSIVIPITSGNLDIANSDAETVSLFVYLKNAGLVDNSILEFNIPATAHGFTAHSSGSAFASTFTKATISNQMLIDVVASKLIIGTQPSSTACPNSNLATPPVFRATDYNNNIDTDFNNLVTLSNSGGLGMINNSVNAISGVATFTNLQFTSTGTVTLGASATGISAFPASNSIVVSVANATGFSATNGNAQSIVSWTNPSCMDEVMIVAKAGSAVSIVPTGNGSSYTGNLNFGSGTMFDGGYVIYKGTASPQTLTNLVNGTTYHLTVFTRKGTSWSTGATTTCTPTLASSPSGYFRSNVATGSWATPASWQSSNDNITWFTATLSPTLSATKIDIRNGHTIQISTSGVSMSNTTVQNGGVLEITTSSSFELDGDEDVELTVENGGIFLVNSPGSFDHPDNGVFGLIKTGGKLIAGPSMGSGSAFVDSYLGRLNGLFYFGDQAICEWLCATTTLGASSPTDRDYFFPYESGNMPIFRVTTTPAFPYGGTQNNIFYAVLEANSNFTLQNSGTKTFTGGVRGTATVTQQATSPASGNLILGDGTNIPEIGGTVTLNVLSAGLRLPNGANVPATANVKILSSTQNNTINRTGGFLTVDGILDITNMRITNTATGGVVVNGTLRTSNTAGLYGTGTAIPSGTLTLNDNSTVDYYATLNQTISSAPNYYNITFSGGGTKTPQNATNVNTNGTVTITGNPIVDFTNYNLASTGANDTKFTMDSGRFIVGTGGTQPRPGGTYNITGGIIEFAGNSVTDIRVLPHYYDVVISGENKRPGAKGFTINNVLSVTSTGKLTIPEELDNVNPYVVNAKKGIQVASGGEALFKNNANLLQDIDAANSGSITMERNANVPSLQYNYWSSPTKNQVLYSLYSGIPNNSVMVYNSSNDRFTILTTASNPLSAFAKGYSVKGSATLGDAITANFIGEPNNETTGGINTIALSTAGSNYNLIGNPYPSNLNIQALYNDVDNASKFYNDVDETPTAYFWDNTSNDNLSQVGSGYVNQNYAIFNLSSGVGTSAPRLGLAGKKPNGIVKPGQGFIIRASETGGNLTFKNAFRIGTSGTGGVYYKMSQESNDKYWLRLTTPNDMNIVIALAYNPQASNSFERFDSTIFSESVTENFYSLSSDSKKLAIQSRKGDFDSEDVIPLVVKSSVAGINKIGIDDKAGVFADSQNIYLKDKLVNQIVNLSEGDYTFSAAKGTDATRFEIVYKDSSVLGNDETAKSDFIVYRDGNSFVIKSAKKLGRVEVYDTAGRLVRQLSSKENSLTIDATVLPNGVYIIKAENSGDIKTKKIIK